MTSIPVRKKGAKAELLMLLAVRAEEWGDQLHKGVPTGEPATSWGTPTIHALDTWPVDDPFRIIAATYNLSPRQLQAILSELGQELENRAERLGYGTRPEPVTPGPPRTRYVT